jgi:hypothetical protein
LQPVLQIYAPNSLHSSESFIKKLREYHDNRLDIFCFKIVQIPSFLYAIEVYFRE